MMRGNADKPIEKQGKDEFEIQPYVKGLGEFIKVCETPMTIAVQGDWGSGKTSMMNMVRDWLAGESPTTLTVWFNTWQFSQFNMDEQLVLTFMNHLMKELERGVKGDTKSIRKEVFFKSLNKAKDVINHIATEKIGVNVFNQEKADISLADEIQELKESFREMVKETTGEEGRVVIFIDDLDRLQPSRAIELLEVLKLFIDCENCVFVMAIDTSVVFQGIREKYGENISEEKAQSFFDKLIQLPFKMPVAYYKIDKMVERLLGFLVEDTEDTSVRINEMKEYKKLIEQTTMGNPRSIKRLANYFLLIEQVAVAKEIYDGDRKRRSLIRKVLVSLSCMQLKYEKVYNFLLQKMSTEFLRQLTDPSLFPTSRGAGQLIKRLQEEGATLVDIENEISFEAVVPFFIVNARKLIDSYRGEFEHTQMAYEKVDALIKLNKLTEATVDDKEYLQECNSGDIPVASAKGDMFDYSKRMKEGDALNVYNQMIEEGVYPDLQHCYYSEEKNEALKQYYNNEIEPTEFYLFRKINEKMLENYECSTNGEGMRLPIVRYQRKESSATEGPDFRVVFNRRAKSFTIEIEVLAIMSADEVAALDRFVKKMRKEYKNLQEQYGKELFPDKDFEENIIERVTNAERFTGYQRCQLPILSKRAADIFIDYAMDFEFRKKHPKDHSEQVKDTREIAFEAVDRLDAILKR